MNDPLKLPDWNLIDLIRRSLWCGRDFGRAAVMVGTGFSRNAIRISPNAPNIPLWAELAKRMHRELYPDGDDSQALHETPSQLARRYELVFGSDKYDEFLENQIPDKQYVPGKLHEMLLSLPWSDIFTTNYDTLLERTLSNIYTNKYDIVYTKFDLPASMQPRIIKLHGSFPSHRPYIMTEEHYRRFPIDNAAFVNTVQQSMLENVFVLIGYSGSDPDFLEWTGWIRDNLGESAPKIFLCGVLSLNEPTRKLLASRNVIPIDLSPIFPVEKWVEPDIRHSRGIEWFLHVLHSGPNID